MDPMTIAALANIALQVGGQFMQSNAQSDQQSIQQRALAEQKANAKQQMKLATATQTDAYGNKLIYTPGIGWHYDLTPQQKALNAAARGEQQKSLTTDATLNRQDRARGYERAREGQEGLFETLNKYRYGEQPSEARSIADLTRLGVLGYERGAREGSNLLAKQALRMNNSSLLPKISRLTNEQLGGRLEEALLKGRSAGKQEYRADVASRNQDLGGWLEKFRILANEGSQANIASPGAASGDLGAPNMSSIIQALQNAASGSNSALTSLANSSSKPGFDLGALGPSILALGTAYKNSQQTPATPEMSQQWFWDEGTTYNTPLK